MTGTHSVSVLFGSRSFESCSCVIIPAPVFFVAPNPMHLSWRECSEQISQWRGPYLAKIKALELVQFFDANRCDLASRLTLGQQIIEFAWRYPEFYTLIAVMPDGSAIESTLIGSEVEYQRDFKI